MHYEINNQKCQPCRVPRLSSHPQKALLISISGLTPLPRPNPFLFNFPFLIIEHILNSFTSALRFRVQGGGGDRMILSVLTDVFNMPFPGIHHNINEPLYKSKGQRHQLLGQRQAAIELGRDVPSARGGRRRHDRGIVEILRC